MKSASGWFGSKEGECVCFQMSNLFFFFWSAFLYLTVSDSWGTGELLLLCVDSPVTAHGLQHRLQSTKARELLCAGLVAPWHVRSFPQPGIEPMSPAFQGGFLITGSSGKSHKIRNPVLWCDYPRGENVEERGKRLVHHPWGRNPSTHRGTLIWQEGHCFH